MGYRDHLDHKKTRRVLRQLITSLEGNIMANLDRISAALDGLTGDIQRLKDAAAALQAAVDAAVADKDAAVAAAVTQAQADFDAALAPLADRAEALDAETPDEV
jgi:hypothetical protein